MSGIGIVMSGGGARGAYEVGVLDYLFGDFIHRYHYVPHFDVLSGTSVGAVNATALASTAHDPTRGIDLLSKVWLDQELSDVLHFNLRQAARLYRVVWGGGEPVGLFDSRHLAQTITHRIPWRQLMVNLKSARIRALTICMTNVRTGRSTLYVDRAPGVAVPDSSPRLDVRVSHIRPRHVLASAAMPVVFPPIRIGDDFFCDGGIRMNTPTSPAIRMGVDRLLVIGVSTPSTNLVQVGFRSLRRAPSASALLGKALDALMLDHIIHDLEEVKLVNRILTDAISEYGPDFLERLNRRALRGGHPTRHLIKTLAISPSIDLGSLAGAHLRTHWLRLRKIIGRTLLRLLDVGEGADADLASYVLFDRDFSRSLFDLGHTDAASRGDELAEFLFAH